MSSISLVTKCEGVVEMVVDSLEWAILSFDLDRVFLEGGTMRNIVYGIVECKQIPISCWKLL